MEPQRNFVILVAVLMLAVGIPLYLSAAQAEQELRTSPLVGEVWERGDGLGYNVSLTLGKDGRYFARWMGCLGEYGRAEGTWSDLDSGIELTPSREEGMMRGHLKRLERVTLRGDTRLIPPEAIDEARRMKIGEPFTSFLALKKAEASSATRRAGEG